MCGSEFRAGDRRLEGPIKIGSPVMLVLGVIPHGLGFEEFPYALDTNMKPPCLSLVMCCIESLSAALTLAV